MTPHDFTYWLQGFAELNEAPPTEAQWKAIKDHLALVFTKVTPPLQGVRPSPSPIIPAPVVARPIDDRLQPLRAECGHVGAQSSC